MKTETQYTHTALPWSVDYSGPARLAITGPNETVLAFCNLQCEDGDIDEANAALIVTACNHHARLVAALEKCVKQLDDCQRMLNDQGRQMAASHLDLSIEPARAALASVTG